jgi:hypothetical protein
VFDWLNPIAPVDACICPFCLPIANSNRRWTRIGGNVRRTARVLAIVIEVSLSFPPGVWLQR